MEKQDEKTDRRKFLKLGALASGAVIVGAAIGKTAFGSESEEEKGEKVKVLTADGKLVEVDSCHLTHHPAVSAIERQESRKGIPGKKFVMVIDLQRCGNARKCIEGCQKMHHKTAPTEWIKVKRMQDGEALSPYWLPQPCMHCDNPPCTKVCPVDATFKREDGIVLIDNERCVGCRFCMAACPYNARSFNWAEPVLPAAESADKNCCYSPETSFPSKKGTVEKCDFCPDMAKQGKLPDCITSCPNGTLFFGDEYEDTVTNGEDTFRLSELLRDRAGYRLLEDLGTEPRVYYLPQINRNFEFEEAEEEYNTEDYKII